MREEVAQLVAEGKTREQIYAYYIAKYGSQEPLASPIDKGFNRLAWFFPYLVGASGAAMRRASWRCAGRARVRRGRARRRRAAASEDPTLRERLDDELRDLD